MKGARFGAPYLQCAPEDDVALWHADEKEREEKERVEAMVKARKQKLQEAWDAAKAPRAEQEECSLDVTTRSSIFHMCSSLSLWCTLVGGLDVCLLH